MVNPPQTAPACTYSYFDQVTDTSAKGQINWHNLTSEAKQPQKGATNKEALPCIAAHSYPAKTKEAVIQGGMMTLAWCDLDEGNKQLKELTDDLTALGVQSFIVYSTFSATEQTKRWRVLIELAESIPVIQWKIIQQALAAHLEGDSSATRIQQILFLPADNGNFYQHHINEGQALDPQNPPRKLKALIDEQLEAHRLEQAKKAKPKPRSISTDQGGIIDKVNEAYSMEVVLNHLGYKPIGNKWLHPHSESGSAGVILLDGRYYSHHSNDPLADGFTHDAFDVICQWEFDGDINRALKKFADDLDGEAQKQRQIEHATNKANEEALAMLKGEGNDPEIIPLVCELPEVQAFDYGLLPDAFHDWIKDIQERIQCPPDFLAVGAMIGLAGLVGRKVAIHPKKFDDWQVVPNLWGAMIGRPSIMKTPALNEVLKPLKRLIADAEERYQARQAEFEADKVLRDAIKKNLEDALRKAANGKSEDASQNADIAKENLRQAIENEKANKPPTLKRYIVNDATVEALGELLNVNTNGLILVRDELVGWLKGLDREDNANERAFYLECFNGSGSYTYDRIGRGTIKIESTTVSIIGGIQPSKLAPYVAGAVNMGTSDDGFIQRFQLAVYPDDLKQWRNVDRYPNSEAKNKAYEVFTRLADMEREPDFLDETEIPSLRFSNEAQPIFDEWRHKLEAELRSDIHPAIESHLAKYRSLIPSLALLLCLADEPDAQNVGAPYLTKAIKWGEYLRSHAMRIYSGFIEPETLAAKRILTERKKLNEVFKAKEVQQKGWSGLTTTEAVKKALGVLVEHGYLIEIQQTTAGRPAIDYRWNKNL